MLGYIGQLTALHVNAAFNWMPPSTATNAVDLVCTRRDVSSPAYSKGPAGTTTRCDPAQVLTGCEDRQAPPYIHAVCSAPSRADRANTCPSMCTMSQANIRPAKGQHAVIGHKQHRHAVLAMLAWNVICFVYRHAHVKSVNRHIRSHTGLDEPDLQHFRQHESG